MVAAFFFILAVRDSSSMWVNRLVILNMTLFLLPRFLSLGLSLFRASNAIRHGQIDLAKVDGCLTTTSTQLPMTLVIMPCYGESLATVLASVNSVTQSIYPCHRIHIFLSFDGSENLKTFAQVVDAVGARKKTPRPFPCAEVALGNAMLTICLFKRCGKAHCQGQTINYIKQHHHKYFQTPSDTCVLFLDSDTTICQSALRLFAARLVSADVHRLSQGLSEVSSVFHLRKSVNLSPYHALRVFRKHHLPSWLPYRKLNIWSTASSSKWTCQHWVMLLAFPAQ